MDINENEFSAEDSLKVIRSMIESTKSSISDRSHYFLLWGYATLISCISFFLLIEIAKASHPYYVWFITIFALVLHFIFLYRDRKRDKVRTFIDDAMRYVWIIIGFSFWALSFVFVKIGWQYCFPFYILLYSIGTFVTGSLMKFKPMKIGGSICMVLVAVAPYIPYTYQILLSAFAILISYIIPGHLLRNRYQKTKTSSYGK